MGKKTNCSIVLLTALTLVLHWRHPVFWDQRSPYGEPPARRKEPTEKGSSSSEKENTAPVVKEEASETSQGRTHTSITPAVQEESLHHDRHNWVPKQFIKASEEPSCKAPVNLTQINELLDYPPWNDIDWQGVDGKRHAACGQKKCYFTSRTNSTIGYLVANPISFKRMVQSSKVQKDLLEHFDSKVLELRGDAPRLVKLSPLMACLLFDYAYPYDGRLVNKQGFGPHYPEYKEVVVHKVLKAPDPHIMIGTSSQKYKALKNQWGPFSKEHRVNATAAFLQMRLEFANLDRVFQKYPALYRDFQAIMDVHGNIYHMDVDRMFSERSQGRENWGPHKEKFRYYTPKLLRAVEKTARDYEKNVLSQSL